MKNNLVKIVLLITVLAAVFITLSFLINYLLADYNYKISQDLFKKGKFSEALNYSNNAIKYNKYEPAYYIGRARILVGSISIEGSGKTELKNLALMDVKRAISINPENLVTKRNAVPLYYFLSAVNINLPGSTNNVDPKYSDQARLFYGTLINDYPDDVGVISQVAVYEKRLGFFDEYIRSIERINKLRPDLLEWYLK